MEPTACTLRLLIRLLIKAVYQSDFCLICEENTQSQTQLVECQSAEWKLSGLKHSQTVNQGWVETKSGQDNPALMQNWNSDTKA